MPKRNQDHDPQSEVLEQVRSLKQALGRLEDRLSGTDSSGGNDDDQGEGSDAWTPEEHLKERWSRHEALVWEIERQSDAGAINLDELLRRYHKEYDRPALILAQDLQTRALIYHNVIEALKEATNVEEVARMLKMRYEQLGLINKQENRWPNPLGDWLMRHSIDKLNQFRHAMLELLRTRSRQLLRELNFDPTLAVSFQLSLGTNTSFGISVQPEITVTRDSGRQP
jgi:hypothetical protein